MARPVLYLQVRPGRAPTKFIRYHNAEIRIGLQERERPKAEEMLATCDERRRTVKSRRHRYPTGHIYFFSCPDERSYEAGPASVVVVDYLRPTIGRHDEAEQG